MIGCDFHYRNKIPVAVLGATGSVGQQFVHLLSNHPWFEIKALAASEKSAGAAYKNCVQWQISAPLPEVVQEMALQKCEPDFPVSIVFSALDAKVAAPIEKDFVKAGYMVISNCKNHRMDADVPLLIPEVNSDHLGLLSKQSFGKGKLVTNPNCCVVGLALALKPVQQRFGIECLSVVTLQAVSGAGFSARTRLDICDNVIPFIEGEREKIEKEIKKILGTFDGEKVRDCHFPISAQCNRVNVSDGHLLSVSLKLKNQTEKEKLIQAFESFQSEVQEYALPSAPKKPLRYFKDIAWPQPKLHRSLEKGMAVSIGQLDSCPVLDYRFVVLVHNTIRGGAGGAILIAELLTKKGLVFW